MDTISLKQTFDEVALLFNVARLRNPDALFSILIDIANVDIIAKLLEIVTGNGQATKPIAQKGFEIIALEIEIGHSLAAVAKNECGYRSVQVVNTSFEAAKL